MFSLFKKSKISDVYRLLNNHHEMAGQISKAEDLFAKEDVSAIFDFSGDVNTTVALVLLMRQSIFAERYVDGAQYEQTVLWAKENAPIEGLGGREWIERDVESQCLAAEQYADLFRKKIEHGLIHSNRNVIVFADDRIERMLRSWGQYRERMMNTCEVLLS